MPSSKSQKYHLLPKYFSVKHGLWSSLIFSRGPDKWKALGPGTDPSLMASEGANPADILTSDFQPPQPWETNVCCLRPPECSTLAMAVPEHQHRQVGHFPRPSCFSVTLGPSFGFYGEVTHGRHLLPVCSKKWQDLLWFGFWKQVHLKPQLRVWEWLQNGVS